MAINKTKIILITILLLASILRLWNLTNYPAGFNADEASLGYNAYSLLKTGKDEYGTRFPLVFKSFADFKPGLYVYLALPFVATLGLDIEAVRLPSAILGIFTVFLIYLLGKKIFKSEVVGLVCAFLLAITPWHLDFSRAAWETNVATFFITLAVYLFLRFLDESKYLAFSLISFLAAMYTYQSPRLTVPALVLSLVIIYHKKLLENWRKLIIPVLVGTILIIPLFLEFSSGNGAARFSGLSIFSDPGPLSRTDELVGEHGASSHVLVRLLHNKITAYAPSFLGHYLDHFDTTFLFIDGDPLIRDKVPESGQFFIIEALFLAAGLVLLIRKKITNSGVLIAWILTAPLASALTYQTPNALRSEAMVVPLTLIMGLGLVGMFYAIKKNLRYLFVVTLGLILLFETGHYLESYYIHYPKRYPLSWEYGFSQMVQKLQIYQKNYQQVVITDRYDQPYILVLFFEKYDPAKYQPQAKLSPRDKFNFSTVRSFDKYQFRTINPDEVGKTKGVLYIGTDQEIPKGANIIDKVLFPNGEDAFVFASS